MNEQQIVDRATTLAEMAPHESVTTAILAGKEGRFSTVTPLHEAPVTYLESAEAPAYVLTNGKRGVGRGTKRNTLKPTDDRRTVILVTGRRTLCLIGRESTDEVIEVPHESVAGAAYKTGFRANRLALRTPRKIYHCWVHRKVEESLLDAATTFIEERQSDSPEEIEGDDDANRVMYRGQPVKTNASEETDETETTQTVMYRGQPVDRSE